MAGSGNSNTFSAVLLGDLNDFISPGQACVNPIFATPANTTQDADGDGQKKTKKATIELTFDGIIPNVSTTKSLIKLDKTTKAAKVSLSDCLACSGCVTSAETVLLKQQSVQEFLSVMKLIQRKEHPTFKVAAVTLSPQVRASFAVRFGISAVEAHAKIADFLRTYCGVEYVLDAGALPSDVSQLEVAKEFVKRYRERDTSSSRTTATTSLPLLTSSCPGWVCYAEKTHPHAIPHLCEVKSPQQVAGSVVKRSLHMTQGLAFDQVYHVSIMQCPDKKLEGARKESWMNPENELSAEVNCVLTATELCDAMLEVFPQQQDLDIIVRSMLLANKSMEQVLNITDLERMFGTCTTSEEPQAGSSGGICAFVFRYAARELFAVNIPWDASLPFKPGRNPDTWTLDLEMDGKVVLRFAASYGFRNIQDVVRRIKNRTSNAQFIEVMACPGGCTNGGGLLLSQDKDNNRKKVSENVARAMEQVPRHLIENNLARVAEVVQTNPAALRTTFNAVKDIMQQQQQQIDIGLTQGW